MLATASYKVTLVKKKKVRYDLLYSYKALLFFFCYLYLVLQVAERWWCQNIVLFLKKTFCIPCNCEEMKAFSKPKGAHSPRAVLREAGRQETPTHGEQLEAVSRCVTFNEGGSVALCSLSTWTMLSGCGAAATPSPLEVRHYTECALAYIWQHTQQQFEQELGVKLVNRCILLWTATACSTACCWCVHSIGLPCFPNTACPPATR